MAMEQKEMNTTKVLEKKIRIKHKTILNEYE